VPVQEHHGQLGVVFGDLVEDVGVVHVGGGALPGGVVIAHVKGAVRADDGAARREDALLRDAQGRVFGVDQVSQGGGQKVQDAVFGGGGLGCRKGGERRCHGGQSQDGGRCQGGVAQPERAAVQGFGLRQAEGDGPAG